MPEETLIRVAATSSPALVAAAIAGQLRQHPQVQVQAIGASAVNQMIKATVVARRYLQDDALSLVLVPLLVEVTIDGEPRTAVRLRIQASAAEVG